MASRMERTEPPLVVIVGPTASGKTAVAIELARQHRGEIICADSRTIYQGMDIGTAKPSAEERALVPHWGLDIVRPNERFSASDFKRYADEKIGEIRDRGNVPFLVGGSGLYIDAVIFDYGFGDEADPGRRKYLESLSLEELHNYCIKNNIKLPQNEKNKRYVVRAIERNGTFIKRSPIPIAPIIIVGIATYKDILRQRIIARSEQVLTQSVVEEASMLGKKYGWESEAMTGNIYPLLRSYLEGEADFDEVEQEFIQLDWKLAKRQLTWFRRNPYIMWLLKDDVSAYVTARLAAR